jgi:hypothetical protein
MTIETTRPETGGGLQETAGNLAQDVGATAEVQAATLLSQAGEAIRDLAEAVRHAAGELESRPQIARFGDTAADRFDDAADYLASHQPGELVDEARRRAREQPAIVIGAGFLAGLVVGRLLRTASGTESATGQRWTTNGGQDLPTPDWVLRGRTGSSQDRSTGSTSDRASVDR